MLKVSVLITSFNLEQYIGYALDSVLMQKGSFQLEVLVGDDGSSDATVSIVKQYINNHPDIIRLYEMPRDEGIQYNRVERSSANRINLLENATGDYFCFLDGDDFYLDENKISSQLEILESDKSLSMCSHNMVMYYGQKGCSDCNSDECTKLIRALKEHRWSREDYWSIEFIQANAMLYRNYYSKGNDKCSKSLKEILEENPAYKNNFDDNNITFALFLYGDMYYLPKAMGAYRQSEGSSWNGIDSLKKACSNMIGYSLEQLLAGYISDSKEKDILDRTSLSRHYKDFLELRNNIQTLEEEKCQPFYDTAKKYDIDRALWFYGLRSDNKDDIETFERLLNKAKRAWESAKIKRLIKKILKIY